MTKSDIFCEHANENPNHCKCPPDCICWTATCEGKGPDCSSFSLAGAAYDPYVKDQRRLRDLAKLAYEYGDENLRERLNPSRFGVSCSGPLGLVGEPEALNAIICKLVPTENDITTVQSTGVCWIDQFDCMHQDGELCLKDRGPALVLEAEWDAIRDFVVSLKKRMESRKIAFSMCFVRVGYDEQPQSETALKLSLKFTDDLTIDTYYEVVEQDPLPTPLPETTA